MTDSSCLLGVFHQVSFCREAAPIGRSFATEVVTILGERLQPASDSFLGHRSVHPFENGIEDVLDFFDPRKAGALRAMNSRIFWKFWGTASPRAPMDR